MSKIQVNEIVNHFDNGAPDCPKGLTVTGVSTFSGNVSIGGTLSYEDVTNIDSVGIITAQAGIHVTGGNVGIGTDSPGALLSLESTAANAAKLRIGFDSPRYYDIFRGSTTNSGYLNFYGSQTGFTGYVFDGVDGERVRIDSSGNVGIGTNDPGNHKLHLYGASNSDLGLTVTGDDIINMFVNSNRSSANASLFAIKGEWNGTQVANIKFLVGDDTTNKDDGYITFATRESGTGSSAERMRIDSLGNVNIGPSANANGHGLLTLSQSASAAFNALVIQQGNTAFTATDGLQIGIDAGVNAYFKLYENRDIYFTTGATNTEKLRITSGGAVVVGSGGESRTGFFNVSSITPALQVETPGPSDNGRFLSIVSNPGANAGYSPTLLFGKSRGTTVGGNTGVANNDELGAISWQGADGSQQVESVRIAAEVAATTGTDNIPGRLKFHTNYGTSSPTLALEISKDQDVLYYGSTGSAGGPGGVNVTKRSTEGGSGSMDLAIPGGTFVGTLYVSNVYVSGANARTVATYFVAGRLGAQVTITQLNSATGTSGLSFTITDASSAGTNNKLRYTNTSGVSANVTMHFVGAIGL